MIDSQLTIYYLRYLQIKEGIKKLIINKRKKSFKKEKS